MKVLKHRETGRIYPWHAALADNENMVEIDSSEIGKPAAAPAPVEAQDDTAPIQLAPETPTENSEIASADVVEEDPVEVFRRQASKGKK